MSAERPCPVCGSEDTGGYPKTSSYTGRGRVDIDDWYCHGCKSRWQIWDYIREDVLENKHIRLKDGRAWRDGQAIGDPVPCYLCKETNVQFVSEDGHWRNQYNVAQLRYQCDDCGGIWINMTRDDGRVMARRIWRRPMA